MLETPESPVPQIRPGPNAWMNRPRIQKLGATKETLGLHLVTLAASCCGKATDDLPWEPVNEVAIPRAQHALRLFSREGL